MKHCGNNDREYFEHPCPPDGNDKPFADLIKGCYPSWFTGAYMKKDIHPEFREVVFRDVSCDWELITKSTIKAKDTATVGGKEYPLVKVDISSASHPFYTGKQRLIDAEGRAEKFRKKYGKK
jgi:large subunit ribosomal protein L31